MTSFEKSTRDDPIASTVVFVFFCRSLERNPKNPSDIVQIVVCVACAGQKLEYFSGN